MKQLVIVYQLTWHNISEDMHCNLCLVWVIPHKRKINIRNQCRGYSLSFKCHKNYFCAYVQQQYIVRISKFWKMDNSKATDASLSLTKNSLSLHITFLNIIMHFILRTQINYYKNKALLQYYFVYSITTNTALVTKAQLYNHHNLYRINATTKFTKNFSWCTHRIWYWRNAIIKILNLNKGSVSKYWLNSYE